MIPISIREGDIVHIGAIDLNDSTGFHLMNLLEMDSNTSIRKVNTINGIYTAIIYTRSANLEFYEHMTLGAHVNSIDTCNCMEFTIDLVSYHELKANYNIVIYTGLGLHVKTVPVEFKSLNLDITPYFFCYPTTYLR